MILVSSVTCARRHSYPRHAQSADVYCEPRALSRVITRPASFRGAGDPRQTAPGFLTRRSY